MDLKKSIRKAKRKQFIVIGAITVVSFAVLFVGFLWEWINFRRKTIRPY